ncbi:LysR family transcriptional regulator [Klenkia taihuensis]|uniref:DNA-binding transcriptional regulator, LysR family n=1 Tax=Klenkia taihuensis TaxID=1225127 RepID=A0A1I1U4J8_9ACTN|nr:LysR family transcriptional regulator [Klenkia taihuensis]GHE06940.1 LysR family transcriptional regulator [Klenkia taihuensis]SFD65689.1 DNA-binding transcriptional regulator, LysR family [Klenkia taihuensis]
MDYAGLRNLDLNLVVTLDALLSERGVTRAATRLGVTQPSVSGALAKLRRHFGDELLIRDGNRSVLTPLAEQLAPRTAAALSGFQRVFDATPDFDASSSAREFTIMVSDYAAMVLGGAVTTVVAQQAPHVRIRLLEISVQAMTNAMETLRTVDGVVLPHGFLSDVPAVQLFEDDWVCILSQDNTEVGENLTMDQLAVLPWVIGYDGPIAFTPAVRQLRMHGVEPVVNVIAETFLAIPFLVAGTDQVALVQRRLADRLGTAAGVRQLPCPWDAVPLAEAFWFHPAFRGDPAHAWLRRALTSAGEAVSAEEQPARRGTGRAASARLSAGGAAGGPA